MTYFTIPASTLRAAMYFAAKNDVRYYLNGVYLDIPRGRIVSTTGAGLFCGKLPDDVPRDHAPVIVPREVIETALKALGRKNERTYLVGVTLDAGNVRLEVPGCVAAGTCIDAEFPQYERILVRKTSGQTAQFDPDLLVAARGAINAYTGASVIGHALQHNGDSAAIMPGKNCLCVVMPARVTADEAELTWLDNRPESEPVAA